MPFQSIEMWYPKINENVTSHCYVNIADGREIKFYIKMPEIMYGICNRMPADIVSDCIIT